MTEIPWQLKMTWLGIVVIVNDATRLGLPAGKVRRALYDGVSIRLTRRLMGEAEVVHIATRGVRALAAFSEAEHKERYD